MDPVSYRDADLPWGADVSFREPIAGAEEAPFRPAFLPAREPVTRSHHQRKAVDAE